MSSPFASPAQPGQGITYPDLQGNLLLIKVMSLEDHIPTVHTRPGEKNPAVRADVTVLDGPKAGEKYDDALIFPKVLQGQLKSRMGQLVLGRLGQGAAKPGQSAPWLLTPATPEDEKVAEEWMRSNQTPTLSQPASQGQEPPF